MYGHCLVIVFIIILYNTLKKNNKKNKIKLCNVWGVARDLLKSSIVTSLHADSRAPDDGRNGILAPSRQKCGDASSAMQAN